MMDYESRMEFWIQHSYQLHAIGDDKLQRKYFVYYYRNTLEPYKKRLVDMALAAGSNNREYARLVRLDAILRNIKGRDDSPKTKQSANDLTLKLIECLEYFIMLGLGLTAAVAMLLLEIFIPDFDKLYIVHVFGLITSHTPVFNTAQLISQWRAETPKSRHMLVANAIAVDWRATSSVTHGRRSRSDSRYPDPDRKNTMYKSMYGGGGIERVGSGLFAHIKTSRGPNPKRDSLDSIESHRHRSASAETLSTYPTMVTTRSSGLYSRYKQRLVNNG